MANADPEPRAVLLGGGTVGSFSLLGGRLGFSLLLLLRLRDDDEEDDEEEEEGGME